MQQPDTCEGQHAEDQPAPALALRHRELECGGHDHAPCHRAHSAECAAHHRIVRDLSIEQREPEHDHHRHAEHAAECRQRPAPAEPAVADHDRQIADIRAGQKLAESQVFGELLAAQPAALLDQHPLGPGQHAAKTAQRQQREDDEEFAQRLGARRGRWRWRWVWFGATASRGRRVRNRQQNGRLSGSRFSPP